MRVEGLYYRLQKTRKSAVGSVSGVGTALTAVTVLHEVAVLVTAGAHAVPLGCWPASDLPRPVRPNNTDNNAAGCS